MRAPARRPADREWRSARGSGCRRGPCECRWGAATVAAHDADLGGQFLDFGAAQLAHEALFDHELGKGRETAVFLQAAVIVEAATELADIHAVQQLFVATRAGQRFAQRLALVVMVFVEQLE